MRTLLLLVMLSGCAYMRPHWAERCDLDRGSVVYAPPAKMVDCNAVWTNAFMVEYMVVYKWKFIEPYYFKLADSGLRIYIHFTEAALRQACQDTRPGVLHGCYNGNGTIHLGPGGRSWGHEWLHHLDRWNNVDTTKDAHPNWPANGYYVMGVDYWIAAEEIRFYEGE